MKRLLLLFLAIAILLPAGSVGCNKAKMDQAEVGQGSGQVWKGYSDKRDDAKEPKPGTSTDGNGTPAYKASDPGVAEAEPGPKQQDGKKAFKQPPAERKIIATANIQLTVADFAKAEQELDQLVQTHKGYFAQADVSGSAGATRQGTWKVRMQAPNLREFGEAVKKLGELVRYTSDAKEVTEEYYDLQIRARNKEAELETLRKIFEKTGDRIEYVLSVQHELNRAQRELEQMKGRQRVLDDLIDLTTITVHIQQRGTFTPTDAPSFGSTVAQTFSGSIDLLIGFGKVVVVVAVAIGPWLPLLAVFGIVVWLLRRRHKMEAAPVAVKPAAEVKTT